TFPHNISTDASNLIKKMLCKKPMQRITIQNIRNDIWFKRGLPKYLSIDPKKSIEFTEKINPKIVVICNNMGFSKEDVETALKLGPKLLTNASMLKYKNNNRYIKLREAAVCYHLHFDKHYRIKFAKDLQKSLQKQKSKDINMYGLDISTP